MQGSIPWAILARWSWTNCYNEVLLHELCIRSLLHEARSPDILVFGVGSSSVGWLRFTRHAPLPVRVRTHEYPSVHS
jgi:hypothetical protein